MVGRACWSFHRGILVFFLSRPYRKRCPWCLVHLLRDLSGHHLCNYAAVRYHCRGKREEEAGAINPEGANSPNPDIQRKNCLERCFAANNQITFCPAEACTSVICSRRDSVDNSLA